jgi:tetratricopeptide (TPR) repeat protein
MKLTGKILFILLSTVLIAACVTTKKKGEAPSKFKKGYHDLTSKYNYWFNADELLTLTMEGLEEKHKENYNQILPVYPYMTPDPLSSRPELDDVIKKSSMAIGLHRVSDWTDDCYTMIGQAQFLKRDYETAESTFKFIKIELDPKNKVGLTKGKSKNKKKASSGKKKKSKKKKRKAPRRKKKKKSSSKKSAKKKAAEKKKEDKKAAKEAKKNKDGKEAVPAYSLNPYKPKDLQQFSSFPLSMIWYGRTLVERDKYDEAEFLFRELHEDMWFPANLKRELALAETHMWMKQKRYDRAIEPLQTAIENTDKKKEKARLAYILSQLYERQGNYQESYAALDVVLKSNPVYEMEFNARLHQTYAGWTNKQIQSSEATKTLGKMLKDDKNLEYRDQIYYTMAEIDLADGNKAEGISHLRSSLYYNESNTTQRSESYLKLADLYFDAEDFVQAKFYYDSTLTVLPNTDERYDRVSTYANNLTDIARLIQTITANDSIVKIFYMDDDARKELAKTLKKQREDEAAAAALRKKAEEAAKADRKAPPSFAGAGIKPSTFYFYNEAFLKKGKRDFSKNWGDRKLEDNWRRSNRISAGSGIEDLAGADADTTNTDALSNAELDDIFRGIPTSEAELAVLHASTYEAMYKLGTLFRDKLQNNVRCSGTLEEMQERYPQYDQHEKETWYYCHLAFKDLGNAPKAEKYLKLLSEKYPNSPYARALTDPNFLNASKEKERELNLFYELTFNQFQDGKYQEVADRCEEAPKKYGSTNPLMPKFALLNALCTGNLKGNDEYCQALGEVIARYPESAEATRAKEIARLLSCKGFEVQEKPKPTRSGGEFTLEDDKLHYFMIVISGDVRLDDIKNSISDYNREYHRTELLRISNIFLGTDTNTPIVVIRKFNNKEAAMAYYNEVANNKDFMGEGGKKSYDKKMVAITQANYRRVLKNRSMDGYYEFFDENYLK